MSKGNQFDNIMKELSFIQEGDTFKYGISPEQRIVKDDIMVGEGIKHSQKVVVVDFDEVIVKICDKWFNLLKQNTYFYNKYIKDKPIEKLSDINMRSHYFMDKEFENLTEEDKKIFYEAYFENETFYDDLEPTILYNILISMNEINALASIHVITKCGLHENHKNLLSKKNKILKLFNETIFRCPLEFHFIYSNSETKSKSELLVGKGINPDIIMEDCPNNIIEYLESPINHCTYIVPTYGYNTKIVYEYSMSIGVDLKNTVNFVGTSHDEEYERPFFENLVKVRGEFANKVLEVYIDENFSDFSKKYPNKSKIEIRDLLIDELLKENEDGSRKI